MKGKLVLAGLALAACTAQQPQATVSALEVSLTAAERLAIQYTGLPRCPAATPICSDADVVKQLLRIDQTAFEAVLASKAAVARGGPADFQAADAAIVAFQAILSRLNVGVK